MRRGRTYRRRIKKYARRRIDTDMLPEWLMCKWICTNGFNKRDCHVSVKYFNGAPFAPFHLSVLY